MALVLLVASPGWAQTTGSITGTVTDSSNAVLPGVRVTATSPAQMGAQVAVTNEQGQYRFPAVAIGTYSLKYELTGFSTIIREGIIVTIGFTASVSVQLKLASVAESVTVTGESPVVDTKNTNIQTNITKEMLDALPNSRDIWTVIGQAPGFMVTSFDVGGSRAGTQTGYSAFGYSGQVRVQVDGVNTTEGTGGAGFYYDYGSFQELQLTGDGADASATTPGVQLNAVVRSGGNKFKGDFYYDYENESLQGHNVTDQLRHLGVTEGTRILLYRDPNFALGGPIIRDKLWFFTSIRDQRTGVTVDNFPVENPGGFFFETRLTNITYKLTYQLSQNNRLSHYIQWGRKFQPHRGAGSTAYSDAPFRQDSWSWAGNLEWTNIIGSKFVQTARYSNFGYDWPNYAYGVNGEVGSNLRQRMTEQLTGNTAGGAAQDWTYRLRHQFDWSGTYFKDNMKVLKGNHGLKFGMVSEWETLREIDYGFKEDISLSFSSTTGSPDFNTPFRVTIRNTDRFSENASWHHGIYLTDQWQIAPRLTANIGLRWDYYSSYFPDEQIMDGPYRDYFYAGAPIPIRDGSAAPSTHSLPATPYAGTWTIPGVSDIRTHASIAPRVGFAYDLRGKGKTVLKFNWGRFYFNTGTASSGINPAQSLTSTFDWIDRNGDKQFQLGTNENTYELGRFRSTTGVTTALIDPDIKHPYTDSTSLWLEHELFRDIGLRVGFTYKSDGNSSVALQLNRTRDLYTSQVSVTDPGPDGLFGNGDDGPNFTVWDIPSPVPSSRTMTTTENSILAIDRAFDITVSRRMRNNWSVMTNFLYNWDRDRGFAQNPNADRFNDNTVTLWAFKVVGSYQAPYGFVISPSLRHQAGDTLSRIVQATSGIDQATGLSRSLNLTLNYAAERDGAYREDNITIFDTRIEKRFRLKNLQGHELGLFFDVFNIANSNASQSADNTVGRRTTKLATGETVEYARFLRPTGVLPPRIFRLGLKYSF
jgi:hypothetical protein